MKIKSIIAFFVCIIIITGNLYANPIEEGKALFMNRCAACHNVNQRLTGPALAGIDERRSMEWIISFVRSSSEMIKKGDQDAVSVYEQFNKIPMPNHTDLSDDNIKQIVEFIKSEAKTAGANAAPFAKPVQKVYDARPLKITDYNVFGVYFFVVACLISSLLFAVKVRSFQAQEKKNI